MQTNCTPQSQRYQPRPLVARVVGWLMLVLALLGFVLPVLPGVVFLALAVALLGPSDPALRRMRAWSRLTMRWCCRQRHPLLRHLGWQSRRAYGLSRSQLRLMLSRPRLLTWANWVWGGLVVASGVGLALRVW